MDLVKDVNERMLLAFSYDLAMTDLQSGPASVASEGQPHSISLI